MAVNIRCPSCGQIDSVKSSVEGKTVRCSHCRHTHRVTSIDRYQILEELGRGAFGVVYRVYDPKVGREAAVKVLHAEVLQQTGSTDTLRRFRNEGQLLAQIVHPHILPLYEAGQHNGRLYLVTALIRGRQLDELIPEHGFADPRRAVNFALPLLDALHYVHSTYGICHRDVKPANIMIGEGDNLFLMDFGLAVCQEQDASRITTGGTALGTPSYMPPEQAQGDLKKIGPASDQYSAGVVLFQMLTGQLPFRKPMPMILHEVISAPPPRPSSIRGGLGSELDRLVLRALEKEPRNRYPDCHAFANDLREWSSRYTATITGGAQGLADLGSVPGSGRWLKVLGLIGGALLTAALLAVGAYFFFKTRGTNASPPTPTHSPATRKGPWSED
jgi:serine/threonine protein kinase